VGKLTCMFKNPKCIFGCWLGAIPAKAPGPPGISGKSNQTNYQTHMFSSQIMYMRSPPPTYPHVSLRVQHEGATSPGPRKGVATLSEPFESHTLLGLVPSAGP